MKILFSALTALAIAAGGTAALADSGDEPQTTRPPRPMFDHGSVVITAAPLTHDVGDERPADFDGHPVQVTHNLAVLQPAAGGNESIVQTWNSAPPGFYDGKLPPMIAELTAVPPTPRAPSEMTDAAMSSTFRVIADPNETVVATVNNTDLQPGGITPSIATRPPNSLPGVLKLHWFGN